MINRKQMSEETKSVKENQKNILFPGYPSYSADQDIYKKSREETEIDPEDITKNKYTDTSGITGNETLFEEPTSGSDLDIPGAELDDQNEAIGNEDEENNYYSIGGDNHNDLEEKNDTP